MRDTEKDLEKIISTHGYIFQALRREVTQKSEPIADLNTSEPLSSSSEWLSYFTYINDHEGYQHLLLTSYADLVGEEGQQILQGVLDEVQEILVLGLLSTRKPKKEDQTPASSEVLPRELQYPDMRSDVRNKLIGNYPPTNIPDPKLN